MILGLGNDLVDIRRIEQALARFGEKFLQRVFTETEIAAARQREKAGPKAVAATLAKRFAAKEACAKALGTGFGREFSMRDIGVVQLASGKPMLELSPAAGAVLHVLHKQAKISISLTDEYPYAHAVVIISAP